MKSVELLHSMVRIKVYHVYKPRSQLYQLYSTWMSCAHDEPTAGVGLACGAVVWWYVGRGIERDGGLAIWSRDGRFEEIEGCTTAARGPVSVQASQVVNG